MIKIIPQKEAEILNPLKDGKLLVIPSEFRGENTNSSRELWANLENKSQASGDR